MTAEFLKQIAQENGYGSILEISFDDDKYYFIDAKDILTENAIIKGDDDSDLLIVRGFIKNKETGLIDIPCKVYRTLVDIRAILVLDNIEDKSKVDKFEFYSN